MNELDALGEFFIIVHNRSLGNSDRAFFDNRFHQEWEFQASRPRHFLSYGKDGESGHGNSMVRENLFRERFVMRKREAAGIATRIGLLEQFEITDHMLVEERMTVEIFEKIERDMRFVFFTGF